MSASDEFITEAWLKEVGFKWDQLERQPHKHWTLWLGAASIDDRRMVDTLDLGIELTPRDPKGGIEDGWYCWIRSDYAHRYCRFIHVRWMRTRRDVEALIYALTGREFDPADCFYGSFHAPENAARIRRERERMDLRMLRESTPHNAVERDETRGRPRQEHQVAHDEALKAKRDAKASP